MIDTVQEDFLDAALDTIDELHGGMESFLRDQMSLDDENSNASRSCIWSE